MLLSASRVTISPWAKSVLARRSRCVSVSGKSIIRPSTEPLLVAWLCRNGDAEHGVGDFEPELGRAGAEALEPECALVEAVEWVLPGEAGTAVHLDRALAGENCGLGGERLRGGGGDRRLLVVLGDAPGGPVGERAGELDVGVRVRELMGDGLVDADRLAELLA